MCILCFIGVESVEVVMVIGWSIVVVKGCFVCVGCRMVVLVFEFVYLVVELVDNIVWGGMGFVF